MAKTHKEHLAEWGYEERDLDSMYDDAQTEAAWQALVAKYGEDNVWDYRILSDAFSTNYASFAYGMMFGVIKRDTNEKGSLNQDGTILGQPRFYFDFRRS